MDYIIKILFIVLFSVFGLVLNMDLSTNARASEYLKEDLEIAVHDASLSIDQDQLSDGELVFDKVKAEQEFKESFESNTGLNSNDYKIIEFKTFDQSNTTFPVNYKASTVKFQDTFTSPTIVAIIETTVNKYFSGGSHKETIRRVASYSYELNPNSQESTDTMLAGSGDNSTVTCTAGSLDKDKFDSGFENAGVFSGKQDEFLKVAQEQGIDPVLFSAIAFAETGKGTSSAVTEKNNPGGLMDSNGLMSFPTLDDGIEAMGLTLHNRILNDGLTTIEKLGSVYAPIGASNDPNNLNANWVPNVTSYANSLGGLTMNCTSENNTKSASLELKSANLDVGSNGKMSYFDNVMKVMLPYQGDPYSWGGSNPSTGFDCSGLMQWAFGQIGINLPRTASEQYKATKRISPSEAKAGDLVFFRGTYGSPDFVSHVGIYVGNGKMFNANDSGIEYSDITTGYWAQHSPEFGRIQ